MIYKKGSNLRSGIVYLTTLTALLVLDSSKLIAGIIQGYAPPISPDRPQRTEGSGSRGCSKNKDVALDLVVPNDHVATTVLGHPIFLWRVSAPAEISFALVEPGVVKPILEKQLEVKKS